MEGQLVATAVVNIHAPAAAVWKALTTPELIKQYLMGANVISDWKEGGTITYNGSYNGKEYLDKGVIKKIEPEKIFQSTYLSSMSGKEDKPENYNLVTYSLVEKGNETTVTLTQDNVQTKEEKEHAEKNWNSVLTKLKDITEQQQH
jgi:uncharacterized protein YndB with AHSA1/START domain